MAEELSRELGSQVYWDKRYSASAASGEGASHEWFRTFEKLRPFLEKELPSSDQNPQILHLGCGDSVRIPRDTIDFSELILFQDPYG